MFEFVQFSTKESILSFSSAVSNNYCLPILWNIAKSLSAITSPPQPTLPPSSCLSACLEKIVLSIYRVKNTEQSPERLCEINKRSLVRVAYVLQPRRDRWRSFLRIESIGSKVDSVQLCPLKINKPTGFFQMIINIFHELDVDTLRMIFYIGRSLNDRMILKLR